MKNITPDSRFVFFFQIHIASKCGIDTLSAEYDSAPIHPLWMSF